MLEILDSHIEVPTSSLVNGNVETNGDKSTVKQEWRLMKLCNAVKIVSRIPLGPIPLQWKNLLFERLLELDQAIVSGKLGLPLKETLDKTDLLVVLRCTMNRYVSTIARDAVEVTHSVDNI